MTYFQYKVIDLHSPGITKTEAWEETLNRLGDAGWQVVGTVPATAATRIILMREAGAKWGPRMRTRP